MIKKIEDITVSNVQYKRITFTKDDGFNFTINPINFACTYANLHCNLARIVHAIPNEFQEHRLSEYIQSKENVLVVNIANARTDDGSFNYYLNQKEFTNSLDLRNKYLHGTYPRSEQQQENDYNILLKLFILTIQKIEDDLELHFPNAVIKRMDLDTTRSKNAYAEIGTEQPPFINFRNFLS